MDLPFVYLGPALDQILVLQGDHRSAYVWEGHLLDQTLRARRPDDLWDFLREKDFHPRVVHRLRATEFPRIFEIGRMSSTDGLAVALPQYMRAMTHAQYLDLLGQYTGFRLQGVATVRGGSRISVTAIRQHMKVLHPDITGETEDLYIHWYTRLALFLLFGCVLFPNISGNLVSLRFLHHLQQLNELPQYSWGAVVLAYMYRSMCRGSIVTQVDICDFLSLLQVTTYSNTLFITSNSI
uniref:Serine/threonine-protein phosphatase 7 long form homolog n=1 Tax=Nicotiana sylvestris TaxID=4096 RepID=A0A1U7VVU4_NICSY|nr:PREDICTED: serine/threonine-protein phosphatase 7 long form homolog [Nicotiana sylvestris]